MPKLPTNISRRAESILVSRTLTRKASRPVIRPRACLSKPDRSVRYDGRSFSTVSPLAFGISFSRHGNDSASPNKEYDKMPTEAEDDAPRGNLSIVFTDIVKSTALWENDAEAMATCMSIHDGIIRELTQAHRGYEVKQNGDGFMIAFPTAIAALQFCLAVQQQLLDQEWPDSITHLRAGKEEKDDDGTLLFRGLRLRMSAHWGEPVCVWNDVIKRMDYLGPMVNRAARFVQVTEGGQIVVSQEFLLEIQRSTKKESKTSKPIQYDEDNNPVLDLKDLHCDVLQDDITDHRFEVRLLGEHQFKGLSELQKLYFIIPQSLSGRLDFWPKHKYVPGSKGNIVPNGS